MRKFQKHAFHFPREHEQKLAEYLAAHDTTISELVRKLLLTEVVAPAIVPDKTDQTITLTFG